MNPLNVSLHDLLLSVLTSGQLVEHKIDEVDS